MASSCIKHLDDHEYIAFINVVFMLRTLSLEISEQKQKKNYPLGFKPTTLFLITDMLFFVYNFGSGAALFKVRNWEDVEARESVNVSFK